jgi:peroxin-1
MASASSLAHLNASQLGEKSFETLEMDPQYAQGLGLAQGDLVREISPVKNNLMP